MTPEEINRVVDYLKRNINNDGGDDPLGLLLSHHYCLLDRVEKLEKKLKNRFKITEDDAVYAQPTHIGVAGGVTVDATHPNYHYRWIDGAGRVNVAQAATQEAMDDYMATGEHNVLFGYNNIAIGNSAPVVNPNLWNAETTAAFNNLGDPAMLEWGEPINAPTDQAIEEVAVLDDQLARVEQGRAARRENAARMIARIRRNERGERLVQLRPAEED